MFNMKLDYRNLVRRAVTFAIFLIGIVTLLFFLLQLTGDPAEVMVGDTGTPEQLEQVRRQYGFDRPLWEQYFGYLSRYFFMWHQIIPL